MRDKGLGSRGEHQECLLHLSLSPEAEVKATAVVVVWSKMMQQISRDTGHSILIKADRMNTMFF